MKPIPYAFMVWGPSFALMEEDGPSFDPRPNPSQVPHSHLTKVQQSDRDVRGVHGAFVIVLQARCQQVTGVWVGVKQTRSEDHDTESKNLDSNGFVKNCFSELSESM